MKKVTLSILLAALFAIGISAWAFADEDEGPGLIVENGSVLCHRGKVTLIVPNQKFADLHRAHGDTPGPCQVD